MMQIEGTPEETTLRANVDDGHEVADGAAAEAGEGASALGRVMSPRKAKLGAVAVAAGAAMMLLAATMSASRRHPLLAPGESVLLQARPRKVLWRYAATLGLWEGVRRSTRFTLTNRRLIIQEGVLKRASRSVPLGRIQDVQVRTGPWQGSVEIASASGGKRPRREEIGPLRSRSARAWADELSSAVADR
jgi:membrane protein YdbS with pleckstrin-like domain